MTYMDKAFGGRVAAHGKGNDSTQQPTCEALVLVIEDQTSLSEAFRTVCDCLDVAVERMSSRDELAAVLRYRRPMAVVAAMDGAGQDGCHVLKTVAAYDRDLPVLLLTGDDPTLLGAVDAVEELWQLSSVAKWPRLLGIGAVVDFLSRAGRRGGCMRLMSI
jgi:CheY-like chemotaxis protein